MSDTETFQVVATTDTGTRNQWGRGLFYRLDGKKQTIAPRSLVIFCAICFGVVVIWLLLQGPPDEAKQNSPFISVPPSALTANAIIIPEMQRSRQNVKGSIGNTERTSIASDVESNKTQYRGPQLITRPQNIKIPSGSLVKAKLISGASDGPVRAEVIESFFIAGEQLIPQGTVFLGQGQSGENRLSIRFSQMIFKDGAVETIDAIACDETAQTSGLKGSLWGSKALQLAAGVGLNFVGSMADAFQSKNALQNTSTSTERLKKTMMNGAGHMAFDQSRELLSDTQNKPAVIEIPIGAHFFILFQKD